MSTREISAWKQICRQKRISHSKFEVLYYSYINLFCVLYIFGKRTIPSGSNQSFLSRIFPISMTLTSLEISAQGTKLCTQRILPLNILQSAIANIQYFPRPSSKEYCKFWLRVHCKDRNLKMKGKRNKNFYYHHVHACNRPRDKFKLICREKMQMLFIDHKKEGLCIHSAIRALQQSKRDTPCLMEISCPDLFLHLGNHLHPVLAPNSNVKSSSKCASQTHQNLLVL